MPESGGPREVDPPTRMGRGREARLHVALRAICPSCSRRPRPHFRGRACERTWDRSTPPGPDRRVAALRTRSPLDPRYRPPILENGLGATSRNVKVSFHGCATTCGSCGSVGASARRTSPRTCGCRARPSTPSRPAATCRRCPWPSRSRGYFGKPVEDLFHGNAGLRRRQLLHP